MKKKMLFVILPSFVALATVIFAEQRTVDDCIKDCDDEYAEAMADCARAGVEGSGFEAWENEHDCDPVEIKKDLEECKKDCQCMHNND